MSKQMTSHQGCVMTSSIPPSCTTDMMIKFTASMRIGKKLASLTGGELVCISSAGGVNGTK